MKYRLQKHLAMIFSLLSFALFSLPLAAEEEVFTVNPIVEEQTPNDLLRNAQTQLFERVLRAKTMRQEKKALSFEKDQAINGEWVTYAHKEKGICLSIDFPTTPVEVIIPVENNRNEVFVTSMEADTLYAFQHSWLTEEDMEDIVEDLYDEEDFELFQEYLCDDGSIRLLSQDVSLDENGNGHVDLELAMQMALDSMQTIEIFGRLRAIKHNEHFFLLQTASLFWEKLCHHDRFVQSFHFALEE